MKSNPFWIAFLSLIAFCIVLYSGHTFYLIWNTLRLDKQVPLDKLEWSVETISDEDYVPRAHYQYTVQGHGYEKEELWNKHFLNEWTTQEAIRRFQNRRFVVWIDHASPEFSSLQKTFPYKESFSTVFLWMLGLYFYCLNFYIKQRYY